MVVYRLPTTSYRKGNASFGRRYPEAGSRFFSGEPQMLNYMRRHAQGTTIKILFWIIIAVFVLWGVGTFTGSDSLYAVSVNGETIPPKEVHRTAQQLERFYRQLYGENLTPELVKTLDFKNRALEQMINTALLKQEAQHLGFSVTDDKVHA